MGDLERIIYLSCFLLCFGFKSFSQCDVDVNPRFPIVSIPDSLKTANKRAFTKLELSFRNGRIKGKQVPFLMTNYAKDTIWGYSKPKDFSSIQNKFVKIKVKEEGKEKNFKITPQDLSSLIFCQYKDSLFFRSVWFTAEFCDKIENGEILKSDYLINLSQKDRLGEKKVLLLQEIIRDHFSLLEYHVNSKSNESVFFVYYKNELYVYSYEFFTQKNIIGQEITKKQFYAIHPFRWVRMFNKLLI